MNKLLQIMIGVIGLATTAFAETPTFLLHAPSWCRGVILTEVGKKVSLRYCYQHEGAQEGPVCRHESFCNPDFGAIYRDEFTFSRQGPNKITAHMKLQMSPTQQLTCCAENASQVAVMTVRPSVSRTYDKTINSEDEMCAGLFGSNWRNNCAK